MQDFSKVDLHRKKDPDKKSQETLLQKEKSFTPAPSAIGPVPIQKKPNLLQKMQDLPEEARSEKLQPNALQKIQRKLSDREVPTQNITSQKMPAEIQAKMENSFGADFSNVSIHQGDQAGAINAKAFTQGNDIHFAPGQYDPQSRQGQELLGHELTHVVQQRQGRVQGTTQLKGVSINDNTSLEQEADKMGEKAASSSNKTPASFLSRSHNGSSVVQKKDSLDIQDALNWYKNKGKNVVYSDELASDLYKSAGSSYKALYESVLSEKSINENFVRLVAAAQTSLKVQVDGKHGKITSSSLNTFRTGGEHGIDYARLFKDKKLDIGIAVGQQFDWEAKKIIAYLSEAGFKEKSTSDSKNTYTAKISYKTPGDNTAGNIDIDVNVELTWGEKMDAKSAYTDFLANKEVSIYSGHARYGTGPDFDEKDQTSGNFVIGKGYDQHMNEILKDNKNDLKEMSKAGKFDMNSYQLWFFNACSSQNYMDEVRGDHVTDKSGNKKSQANLRFIGSKDTIHTDALPMLKSIIEMKNMEEILKTMNAYETKITGKKKQGGYFYAD